VVAVGLALLYGRNVAPAAPPLEIASTVWQARFPFDFSTLTSFREMSIIPATTGVALFVAGLAAVAMAGFRAERRRLLAFVVAWGLPPLLFWSLHHGNSARHLLMPSVPFVMLTGTLLTDVIQRPAMRVAACAALVGLNSLLARPGASVDRPSARLVSSLRLLSAQIRYRHERGRGFAGLPDSRLVLVRTWQSPYALFELFSAAESIRRTAEGDEVVMPDGSRRWVRHVRRGELAELDLNGSCVWSMENGREAKEER
jgi:hypothetical protein